jgi:glycerophosphoryl diester phosphodiesterase
MNLMTKLKKVLTSFMILILTACDGVDSDKIDNLFSGYVHIIGHGGSGFSSPSNQYPQNSLLSISRALDGWGVDGVEVDVQMTSDSIPVLFHDASLESSSNCTGFIRNYTLTELRTCGYRQHFYDEKIISLEFILNRYRNCANSLYLFLDIKLYSHQEYNYEDQLVRALDHLLSKYPEFTEHILVQSGSTHLLQKIQDQNSIALLMLKTDDFNKGYRICSERGLNGLVISCNNINRAQADQAHGLNFYISLTNVSSRNDAVAALRKNPDFIQTDNIPLIQKILR